MDKHLNKVAEIEKKLLLPFPLQMVLNRKPLLVL